MINNNTERYKIILNKAMAYQNIQQLSPTGSRLYKARNKNNSNIANNVITVRPSIYVIRIIFQTK